MNRKFSLKQIEEAIRASPLKDQQRLLHDLPRLLNISPAKLGLLKTAEPSFHFWNNTDDDIYDSV